MKVGIGLENKNRESVIEILNALLADELVLSTKTRNYHWNVVGPQFSELHRFFDVQYHDIDEIVDQVAERARTLGGPAEGTLSEFQKNARLREHPGVYPEARAMLQNLLADHEAIVRQLRIDMEICMGKYGDLGTGDFLTGLMGKHEKAAWMVRAFLDVPPD